MANQRGSVSQRRSSGLHGEQDDTYQVAKLTLLVSTEEAIIFFAASGRIFG